MTEQILTIVRQVLILFLMMGVGVLLGKLHMIGSQGTKCLSTLLINVSLPCTIFNALVTSGASISMKWVLYALLIIFIVTLLCIAVSTRLYKKQPEELRSVLQIGSVYGNAGFMGIALVNSILGPEAVVFASVVMIIETPLILCHAPILMSNGKVSLKKALLTPGIIAFCLGLICFSANITIPETINSAIVSLSKMNTGMAMILMGLQMSEAKLGNLLRKKMLFVCSAYKLLVIPLIAALLLYPLHLPYVMFASLVICKGTPQAALLCVFAEDYHKDAESAAQLITLSSILQIVTIPIVALMCSYFNG